MAFLSSSHPNLTEKTASLKALELLLIRLYAITKRELGAAQAQSAFVASMADTPFAGCHFSEHGFAKTAETMAILAAIPQTTLRKKAYIATITALLTRLATRLDAAYVTAIAADLAADVAKQVHVPQKSIEFYTVPTSAFHGNGKFRKLFAKVTPKSKAPQPVNRARIDQNVATILGSITESALIVDELHKIVFANTSLEQLLGVVPGSLVGTYLANTLHLANETSTISDMVYLPNLYDSSPSNFYVGKNLKLTTAKNQTLIVDVRIERITAPNGTAQYVLFLKPTRTAVDGLQHELELFSITAHELRSPLTALRGYLAILQDELKGTVSADQANMFNRMATSTNELQSIVENILALTRIENHTFHLDLDALQYDDLIQKVIAQIQPTAALKHITITYEPPQTPLPPLVCDRIRIIEVLTNLISNAVKFTPEHGGVWVRVYAENDAVRTEVCDNGIGIDKQDISKLFAKYSQLPSPANGNNTGAGLGLYIAKEIVSAHHGQIWVHAAKGKGATFAFRIPATLSPTYQAQHSPTRTFQSQGQPLQLPN